MGTIRPSGRGGGRPSTNERGYGIGHKRLRARWALRVARGDVACARCGGEIAPDGEPCPRCGKSSCGWDLGHDDHDRSQYSGPEHACCNRATAGRRQRPRALRANWW